MADSAYRAHEAFAVFEHGMPRVIHVGDIVAGDDPLVAPKAPTRGHFTPMSEWVERATQAPGEKRSVKLSASEPDAAAEHDAPADAEHEVKAAPPKGRKLP